MSESAIAIRARNLTKRYRIYHNLPTTAGEALYERLRRPFERRETEIFTALDDVTFDVYRGEVLGILGRNGAGKSTLLKVLSRVTEPTSGEAQLHGRLGSLLEVGTGFHPELTGRENIYLNGTILGMHRKEIREKFDQIVEFAEIEKFLDTQVKRFSSGMYVRLAFSVAAHVNPDILIADEVLAVGDTGFQRKCLRRMDELRNSGRTVLIVSHSPYLLMQICDRCLWLQNGKLEMIDSAAKVAQAYMAAIASASKKTKGTAVSREAVDRPAEIVAVRVMDGRDVEREEYVTQEAVTIEALVRVRRPVPDICVSVALTLSQGFVAIFGVEEEGGPVLEQLAKPGFYALRATVPADLLAPNTYYINLALKSKDSPTAMHQLTRVASFSVVNPLSTRDSWPAPVTPPMNWQINAAEDPGDLPDLTIGDASLDESEGAVGAL